MPGKDKIIGIDLGTTNSCVAVYEFGKTVVIPNVEGARTTPSIVHIDHSGNRLVGMPAKKRSIKYPERTIRSVKRYMGSNHRVRVDEHTYSPEQMAATILHKLKRQAETYLHEPVSRAIVTVPAYFDDSQRLATRNAGRLAGLEILRVINEPTACALAYGFSRVEPGQEMNIIIFDFGGGTFDVSILHIAENVVQVKATNGNNRLGGDDFDTRVAMYINEHVKKHFGVDASKDPVARQRMLEAAEKVKVDLTGMRHSPVSLPFLAVANGEPVNLEMMVTQDEFNKITADLVKLTALPIETALADANLTGDKIDKVVLVGGTTRIPAVQQFIKSYFNKDPAKTINPDEAIAIGASIQGAILNGDIDDLLLLDVIPMSLSVEEEDGSFHRIIDKNTAIPAVRKHTFATTRDRQTTISVHVMQGEGKTPAGNISLARFDISGFPKGMKGEQKVEVTFNVDADGIFQTSYSIAGEKAQQVLLKRTSGLDQEQMAKLAKDETALLAVKALINPPETMEEPPPASNKSSNTVATNQAATDDSNGKDTGFMGKIMEAINNLLAAIGLKKN